MNRILIHIEEGYEGVKIEELEELMRDIQFLLNIKGPRHWSRIKNFKALTDDCFHKLVDKGHKASVVGMAVILTMLHSRGNDLFFFQGSEPFPDALNKFSSIFVAGQNNPAISSVEAAYYNEILARKTRLNQVREMPPEKGGMNLPKLAHVTIELENTELLPPIFSPNYGCLFFGADLKDKPVDALREAACFWDRPDKFVRELDTDVTGCRIISPEMDTLKGLATTVIARNLKTAGDSDKLGLPGRLANEVKEKAAIREMGANRGIKRKR